MSAGRPPGIPADERVLWQGASDAELVARRSLRATLSTLAIQLPGLALFLVTAGLVVGRLDVLAFVLIPAALFWLVPIPFRLRSARRDASDRRYLLTDRRLVIEFPRTRREFRLVNLPDLGLEMEGNGRGSIYFTPPAGGTPERFLKRLPRWLPQLAGSDALLVSIPEAERVMRLMRDAQAEAIAAQPATGAAPPPPEPASQAPIAYQSFTRSASVMPFWFGGAFVGMGLLGTLLALAGGQPIAMILTVPFALIGAFFVRARYLLLRDQARLRVVGVRVPGQVTDVAATGTEVNEVEQWIVRYRFSVDGVERTGQGPMSSWAEVARYAPGDAVEVTYDPTNPSLSSFSYPDAG